MNRKNSNRNALTVTLCLCAGVMFIHAIGYAATEERSSAAAMVSTAQFGTRLKSTDSQLKSIEATLARIDAAKTTAEKNKYAEQLDNTMASYAKAMLDSFDTATKQAQLASKSQGKEGSVGLLKQFEDLSVKHERRLKQVDARAQRMLKASPEASTMLEPGEGDKVVGGWSMLEKIGDLFVSPAQAAIALSIYNACHQNPPNYVACAQAVAKGVIQGNAARNAFNTCWNNQANVKPAWWRAVKRTACTAVLVARLA